MKRLGTILALLRTVRGLTQTKLSRLSGVKRASICEYEKGKVTPDAEILGRLLFALRLSWSALDRAGALLEDLDVLDTLPEREPEGGERRRTSEMLEVLLREVERSSSRLGRVLVGLAWSAIEERASPGTMDGCPPLPADREEAFRHWQRLEGLPEHEQRLLIRTEPDLQSWALAEYISLEGEHLSAGDPDKALKQGELALLIAEEARVPPLFRVRLKAFVGAHLGHRFHIKGNLPAAEQAFAHVASFWSVGPEADPAGLLDEARVLGLLASLRAAQRRLPEAHDLISRALPMTNDPVVIGRLLVGRGKVYEEENKWEEGIAALEEAASYVDRERDPRLLLCIRHNLAWLLVDTGRSGEAENLLPEVRELSRLFGSDFDRFRLIWLEAKIRAAQGDLPRAVDLYREVRARFAEREISFDVALVSLELAAVYAKQGRTGDVKTLARHLVPVFQAQDVHREALAALALFRQAAEREEVTAELADRLVLYFKQARHDPRLKFAL